MNRQTDSAGAHHRRAARPALTAAIALMFLTSWSGPASAVVNLDVYDLDVQWVAGAFIVETSIGFHSSGPTSPVMSEIEFRVDGLPVHRLPLVIQPSPGGTCYSCIYPSCDGFCPDIIGSLVWYHGFCTGEYVGGGVYRCVCMWYSESQITPAIPFTGQQLATVVVDPMGTVAEWNEQDNERSVPIAPASATLDLEVTAVDIVWEGSSFRMVPHVELASTAGSVDVNSDLACFVDGSLVWNEPFMASSFDPGTCYFCTYPACDGTCPHLHGSWSWYDEACTDEYIGGGSYRCACVWAAEGDASPLYPYTGQQYVRVVVDLPGTVSEYNEMNNELTVPLAVPTSVEGGPGTATTWSQVKTLFR